MSRTTAGIIIAAISAISAIAAAYATASSQTEQSLSDFKIQTMGDISGLKAVNIEINKHLDNIDKHLEAKDLQFQSLTSYLLNKK